ncbi:hypothetical protein U1737_08345 [Sphingomonas sp. LB3N6]|uniref:hypothetical protein n=1 Tax=Sphingomonas fucosidasi TaxID=3096164 RepID=UPI002FC8789E
MFEAMLETPAAVVERDISADMFDSTVVRAHHCAVGLNVWLAPSASGLCLMF